MSLSLPIDRGIVPYKKNSQIILHDSSRNNVVLYDKYNERIRAFKISDTGNGSDEVMLHSRLFMNSSYFKTLEGNMHKSIHDFLVNGYYERFFVEESRIGTGGFGSVYKVRHVIDNLCLGEFAVKKIPIGDDLKYLKSALIEVNALEQLHRHPNVITYRHSWLEESKTATFGPVVPCLFVLMDYANGGNLETLILNNPPLSEDMIWNIFYDIIDGLSYLHSLGIIHRDIKPQNLLFHESVCLISDFGTCISSGTIKDVTRTGYSGTIEWQAPELFRDESGNLKEFNEKCDIWSVGLILYFMCYKKLPWKYSNLERIFNHIELANEIRNFDVNKHIFPPGRSNRLEKMIVRLLQKNPEHRPSSNELAIQSRRVRGKDYIPSSPQVKVKDISNDEQFPYQLLINFFIFILKIIILSFCNDSIRLDFFILSISLNGASLLTQTQTGLHKLRQAVPILEIIWFFLIFLYHGRFGSARSLLLGSICLISFIPIIMRSLKKRERKSTIILRPY